MSFVTILPLISALFVFLLSAFVYLKNKESKINFAFFLHSLAITVWLFGTFMMFLNRNDQSIAIFWDKFVYVGVVFIPVFMYYFGLIYTKSKPNFLLYLGYTLSLFFLASIPTGYFVDDFFTYKWGVHTKAQILHHFFLVYFVFYVLLWFVKVFKYYRKNISAVEKQQTTYIFVAFLFLFTIGPLAYFPAYGIGIYPFAYFSGVIFTVIIAYAIVAHRLMDIKLVLRRWSVLLASIFTIAVFALAVQYVFERYLRQFDEFSNWVNLAILILALPAFSTVKNYYYHLANKYFFTSLYDSRQVLVHLGERLRSTLDIDKIYGFISSTLTNSFHAKAITILVKDPKEDFYQIAFNSGFQIGDENFFFENRSLFDRLFRYSEPVVIEELKSNLRPEERAALEFLIKKKVAVIMPLNLKTETLGLIVLNAKESGDMYNEEDMETLKAIAAQSAVAIKNAQLYEETKNFSITLQKEVDRQTAELKNANIKLQQLDKAKTEFISIASHQLRTPLSIIKGFVSMMLEGTYGQISEEIKDKLRKTYESAERLIRLVDALLDLSHIESGKINLEMKKMDLVQMVRSVVEELKPEAEEKNIELKFENPDQEYWVLGDEEKLRQVVMNLIDNAVKYTKEGEVLVYFEEKEGNVRLAVKDTGMGMRREEIASLFQKFVRGSEAAHYHTEGTGIGLYVAKRLLEEQKGEIGANSEGEGKGSEFFISMPVWKERAGIINSVKSSISNKGQKIAGRLRGLMAK